MFSKKISLILLFLFVLCFSLTYVSASQDNATVGELTADKNIDIESSVIDEDVISEDSDKGNFSDLDNLIKTGDKEINLEKDYIYDGGNFNEGISITNLTIDGQGHTINANNQAAVFQAYGSVTIKNINFVNAKGSVIGYAQKISIINCTFVGNSVEWGAIRISMNNPELLVENCSFINNSCCGIYISEIYKGNNCVSVLNCSFVNNTRSSINAVAARIDLNVSKCRFINNSNSPRNAVLDTDELKSLFISDCDFINNKGDVALSSYSDDILIVNVSFVNNTNGAMYVGGHAVVSNSTFINNSADNGGAIYVEYGHDLSIVNCNFVNNAANECGGVLFSNDNDKDDKISITKCTFADNSAVKYGGVLYSEYGNNIIEDSKFTNNSAGEGGAIYLFKGMYNYLSVMRSDFTNNYANNGGAVYASAYNEVSISDCNFINNNQTFYHVGADKFDVVNSKVIENGKDINGNENSKSADNGNSATNAKSNPIKLTLKKVTVKKSAKKLVIQATLKSNGKPVKGKIIKFKFNKKTYKAKTNAKGVAKITVKKAVLKKLKKGKKVIYTATYGKITKKVTVKVK